MKAKHNEISSHTPATEDLILRGKNIVIEGEGGTLPLTGAPLGGGGASNIAVYDPDIAATAGNRYKTWAEVMVAVASWGDIGGQIAVKKSGIFQVATVPAGTYDLSRCHILSDGSSIIPTLSFADGTTLSGFPRIVEGVSLLNKNTSAPLHTVSGFGISIVKNGSLVNDAAATQPLLSVPLGANFTLMFDGNTSPLYKNGSSETVFVEGTLAIDVLRIPDNSFFSQTDIFANGFSGNGNVNVTSYVLLPGGYAPSHANYDGNFNVQQKAEGRVSELITSSIANLQVTEDTVNSAASNFVFTGATAPSGTLSPNRYKWRKYAGNLLGMAIELLWSVPGNGITKFTCELATQLNPVTYPGFSSTDVPKYFLGTVSDGVNYHKCTVRYLRPNSDTPALLEVTMDSPLDISYFHCDFTYRFSP